MSQYIYKPEVTVVSKSELYDTEALQNYTGVSEPDFESSDLDLIPEIAGRTCYQSFANPRPGGNKTYIGHILKSGHGSVLEHSVVTLLITGVSRSLTHELIRHRAGTGFSQLSQRYVDTKEMNFVVPPLIVDKPEFINEFSKSVWIAKNHYEFAVKSYISIVGDKWIKDNPGVTPTRQDLTYTRKKAREAARSLLPNCVETHIVMSGNLRAWRNIIEQRACIHADLEIRRLFVTIGTIMTGLSPNVFQDMEIFGDTDGYQSISFACKKV